MMSFFFLCYIAVVLFSSLSQPFQVGKEKKPVTFGVAYATMIIGVCISLFLFAVYSEAFMR